MKTEKTEKKQENLYVDFSAKDAECLKKIDAKLSSLQKQNKKSAIGFFEVAKTFVLNAIEVAKNHKIGNYNSLPKRLLTFVEERDIDELYHSYIKDTKALANNLFNAEMNIEEICAIAIEYVRISSTSFCRYDSESLRNEQSELAEQFSAPLNGVLSFYFGLASELDRAQFLERLINCGIDIKKKISYCETIVDAYGTPITQIIQFKGKPVLSMTDYNGVVKTYIKNTKKSSKLYQFLNFSEYVPQARQKALEVFKKYHNFNVFNTIDDFGDSIEELATTCYKNMSELTASEQNMLVVCQERLVKFSTIIEMALLNRNWDFELISDLFEERLASIKVIAEEIGNAKIKIFPNKVLDENYEFNERKNYLLNKSSQPVRAKSSDNLEEELKKLDEELAVVKPIEPINLDDVKPVPAQEVLDNLKVKFCAPSNETSFEIDGMKFDFSDDPAMNALGIVKNVDLDEAEKERLLFEQEMGIKIDEPKIEEKSKRKSFYDAMEEIADRIKTNRIQKLQERFEELEKNGELNSQNDCENVENSSKNQSEKSVKGKKNTEKSESKKANIVDKNVEEKEDFKLEEKNSKSAKNSNNTVKNGDNIAKNGNKVTKNQVSGVKVVENKDETVQNKTAPYEHSKSGKISVKAPKLPPKKLAPKLPKPKKSTQG